MKHLRAVALPCLLLLFTSCRDSDGTRTVLVDAGSRDMATGYSAEPAADDYPLWVDLTLVPRVAAETLRVVRWPAGDLVPGEWRRTEVTGHYVPVSRFEPDTPLAAGWYAIQLEMPDWTYRFTPPGTRDGDLETLRVHLGPLPTVRLYRAPEPGSYLVEVSENIVVAADYDMLDFVDYRVDGVRRVCRHGELERYLLPRGSSFNGFSFQCEPMPEGGSGELRFGDGLVGTGGHRLIDYRGSSPPFWALRSDDPVGGEVVPEEYFALTSADAAP